MSATRFCFLAGVLLSLCGCVKDRCHVLASQASPPISFTSSVLDECGRVHKTTPEEVTGHFKLSTRKWFILWGKVPLNQVDWDLSAPIGEQVRQGAGTAAVNLTIKAWEPDPVSWVLSNFIPIVPTSIRVQAQGDIVRFAEGRP